MKQISILLTKYSDWTSRLIHWMSGRGYTHSSIALEDSPERYFSFNHRGFTEETLEKHRRHGVRQSRCYQIQVSDEVYAALESRIQWFLTHRTRFRYSRFGVFCCLLHIPFRPSSWRSCWRIPARFPSPATPRSFSPTTSSSFWSINPAAFGSWKMWSERYDGLRRHSSLRRNFVLYH